ncbi:DUF58 domain-containing protein [Sediminibacillus massiliensis]|uniref:DUF58 domain-containing protein n=1 Tax=Sediminibacillus massiliensis TaxID=1926277 RepID=UPI000988927C|nr:DUF58 domain-containing protein [Sediminibacillus massiliensis]
MRLSLSLAAKFLSVIVLFGVFYSYAMFQGGFVSWFLFYSFLPIILYLFLLLLYPISNWTVSRKLSKHIVRASENVEAEIHLYRKIPFPLYYCVVEEFFPESLQKKDTNRMKYRHMDKADLLEEKRVVKAIFFPWFRRHLTVSYTLDNVPRGEHHLKAFRIKTGDFFGFVKKEHIYLTDSYMLVYPYQRDISFRQNVTSFDEGTTASYTINARNTNVVTGVREYMPGDRFSWIDWKNTAKKNTVMTKEFEQEKSTSILVVLDACQTTGLNEVAFEGSIEVTGSLLKYIKNNSSQVSFLALGEEKIFVPFDQSPEKLETASNYLARIQPGGTASFSQQMSGELRKIPNGLVTFLVTTHLEWSAISSVEDLKKKSRKIILFLIKPTSQVTEEDTRIIHHLSSSGISVNVLTEEQLTQQKFEVST